MQAIKITDGRTSLWQWDTGVRIKVYGCTDVDQMHFVTPGGIISRELVDGECGVPDTAMQTEGLLKMYAFDRTENGGVTRCDFLLMVKARPKPADYIDPPDEYDNLEELAKRIAPLIPGGGGSVTPEQIGAAVEEYLAENPIEGEPGPQGPQGERGEQGPPGADGSDATVTAENVTAALGYTPANKETVESLSREIGDVDAQTITAVSSSVEPADQHYSFGAPVQGFNSVTGVGTFWVTDKDPSMKAIIGKTLKSITLHVTSPGNLTIRGYDGVIDGALDSGSLKSETAKANAEGYDLFTIATALGVSTYRLDGSDSRVTIKRESLKCPNTIGLFKQGENATFYFSAWEEPSKYVYFTHSAMDDSQRLKHRLGFAVSVGETSKNAGIEISAHTKAGTTHKTIINPDELKPLAKGDLHNLSISILGDSISTFEGHIPDGYAHYYPMGDIQNVEQTWWKQLVNETGLMHISQAAWSGSTVTGDSTSTTNAYAACSSARVNELSNNDAFTPDIVLVYIGINDFGLSNHRDVGSYDGTTEIPAEGTKLVFSEAYALMLKKIMEKYPRTTVYCCTLPECSKNNYDQDGNETAFPTKNYDGVALEKYNSAIADIAKAFGARVIDLHSCGIHKWNVGVYTIDGIHPNAAGAVLIKDCIKRRLLADFSN